MSFAAPHFAEPQWLWLALAGPVLLVLLLVRSARARRRQLALLAAPDFVEALTRSHSPWRRNLKNGLLIAVLVGVGFTLARPQWGEQDYPGQMLGEDIVFVLDCSRSMLASDVSPNRLDRARLAVLDFVQRRGRGRVGLVAFAGQAFLQCPLTFDYSAFEDALKATDDRTIPIPGTDIGRALDEASRAIEKNDRRKILVLLTDGEDLEKGGITKARELAKDGAIVYTVGVGTPYGADVQILNERNEREPLRDKQGQVVHSRLDENTLQEIARVTHGSYYPLGGLGEGLVQVLNSISTLDTVKGLAPGRRLGVDRFYVPLSVILVLLLAEPLIGTRRRPRAPTPPDQT